MKIFIACDHQGVDLEKLIMKHLNQNDIHVEKIDISNNELDDYPDFAFMLCKKVIENNNSLGILICGNGIGMSIAANKVSGIRCARCLTTDDAFKAKNHNGCNVIALSAEVNQEECFDIVDTFISTKSASIDRHLNRINKIINYENGAYNEL